MFVRTPRPLALGVSAALVSTGLLLASPSTASAAVPTSPTFTGLAYGSTAVVGPVNSGATAKVSVCSGDTGKTYGNNVAGVNLGTGIGTAGAITTSMVTTADTNVVTSKTTNANLVGGLIKATAITSTATAKVASDGTVTTSGDTDIAGLTIAGLPATLKPSGESKIDIPGVATVTVNSQAVYTGNGLFQRNVTGLRVDLLKTSTRAAGTIVLSSALSGIHTPTAFRAAGQAYATQVDLAGVVTSGQTALVNLRCGGTNGNAETNSTVGLNVPSVLSAGTASSFARSTEITDGTKAELVAKVAGVNLLNGLVKADAVEARSTTTRVGSELTTTSAGTKIVNLTIAGQPIDVSSAENSKIDIEGVGTLTIRKVVKYTVGSDVYGLELKLSTDQLGLKAGSVIQVAAAKSRVTP